MRKRRSIWSEKLPGHAPMIGTQLWHPTGEFDCRWVEMREAAFSIGRVNSSRECINHLAKTAFTVLQLGLHLFAFGNVNRKTTSVNELAIFKKRAGVDENITNGPIFVAQPCFVLP